MKFLKKWIRRFILLFFLFVLAFGGVFLYVKLSPTVPINSANNITLFDLGDQEFFKGSGGMEWVELKDISQNAILSTINCEDKNFYKHFGFDFFRIVKAMISNIQNKNWNQGASTITQQYAKNLFLDFDRTWKRKWDEAWYTLRLEAHYSKDEILEGYLNTINYGHGVYGIMNASKFYFGKEAKDLTLGEASLLAGIPKAPSNYSPITHFEDAKKRQLMILNLMKKNKVITEEDANRAYQEEITIIGKEEVEKLSSINYYQDAVIDELKTIDKIPHNYSDVNGLKIYTTFDYHAQEVLEENVKNALPEESSLEVSSVVMRPEDGAVLALVGGRDYNRSSYNRAISSSRQVGSTMKPYLYYAALENGFTASSSFLSKATTFSLDHNKTYSPVNYNEKYGDKPISMATAIAYSDNIYAVKTHLFLGEDALINVARRVGITEKLEMIPSLPLGTNEINILHMAAGYSAFANLGYKVSPHFIRKVEDGDGNLLYERKEEKELVLNPSLVFILNNLLTATYDSSYIDYNYPTGIGLAAKLKHTYALKSGTTSSDNWNIGFNKNVLCAVWVGNDDNTELTTKDYKYSQNIWYQTVEELQKDVEVDEGWYEKPNNVVGMLVEPISGKPLSDTSKNTKLVYFLKGTEPKETDPTFDEIEEEQIQG